MVLSSAAASTQTTILPTARTTLSMAVFKAIPTAFGGSTSAILTPTVSTLAMGGVSIALYVGMNYLSNGNAVIQDSVSALGVWIAFYYGLTGLVVRLVLPLHTAREPRNLWLRGILPLLGWVMLWFAMGWALWYYWKPVNSYTSWTVPWHPSGQIGGVFVLDIGAVILGIVLMFVYDERCVRPTSGARCSTATRRPGCRPSSACRSGSSGSSRTTRSTRRRPAWAACRVAGLPEPRGEGTNRPRRV